MIFGTAAAERAILSSHEVAVRCEAWRGGRPVGKDLPLLSDAKVSVDSSRFVRRQASLSFQEPYSGARGALGSLLALPGMELRVWRGVRLGQQVFWWPVHWGMVREPNVDDRTRTIAIQSPDRAQRVADNRFTSPRPSRVGFTVAQQIRELVQESIYRVRFVDASGDSTAVPAVTWERDRSQAISDLARSIGCETFHAPDGTWVLRRVSRLRQPASWTVRHGVNLASLSTVTDWSAVHNIVIALGERTDLPPLRGEARDDDPMSPTYVGLAGMGPNPAWLPDSMTSLFTTNAQCVTAAQAALARAVGARTSVDFDGLVHPGLEAGDRIDVRAKSDVHRLVLDSFDLSPFGPLLTGGGRTKVDVEELE